MSVSGHGDGSMKFEMAQKPYQGHKWILAPAIELYLKKLKGHNRGTSGTLAPSVGNWMKVI